MKVESSKKGNMTPDYSKSTAGITLDEELAKNYHAKAVEYALALKATYGSKYSDAFYLNYAHGTRVIAMYGATSANYMTTGCPIDDPKWAGYSYEEIIAMEHNGYNIPEEVLLWAHACQESDVTAYQVVSAEAMLDDGSSTEEISNDFSLENLQKKAKQYITKSQKAQKAAEADMQEYNELAQKAEKIKQEKENTYKNSMKEISKLSNEFKQLDNKFKNGSLSPSEQKRYNELAQQLGSSNSILKEMQIETEDLDQLLSSMEALNNNIDDNLVLADETIKAGEDLAKYKSKTHELQQTHNFSGIIFNDSGLLDDILYGEKGTDIQRIAIDTGKNLSEYSSASFTELGTDTNVQLVEFATNYVTEAKKAGVTGSETVSQSSANENVTASKNPAGENSEQGTSVSDNGAAQSPTRSASSDGTNRRHTSSSNASATTNKNQDSEPNSGSKNINYFVFPVSTQPALTALAAATNTTSIVDLILKNNNTSSVEKQLNKDWAKTERDIQKLQRQTAEVEQKHEEYIQRAETAAAQLEGVQELKEQEMLAAQEAAMNTQMQPKKSNNTQVQNTAQNQQTGQAEQPEQNNNVQQEPQVQNEIQAPAMSPAQAQELALLEQLDYLSAADAKLANKIQKPITQQKAAIAKNQRTSKTLNERIDNLSDRNKNNKKVSTATMSCGVLTSAAGVWNMVQANAMIAMGKVMQASAYPPTVAGGIILEAQGHMWHGIAIAQLVTGPVAIGTATGGFVASAAVSNDMKDYEKSVTNSSKLVNKNNKLLRNSTNVLNTLGVSFEVPSSDGQQQFKTGNQSRNNNNRPEVAPNLGTSRTGEVNFTSTKDISNPARTRGNMIADSVLISDPNLGKKQPNIQNTLPQENKTAQPASLNNTANNNVNGNIGAVQNSPAAKNTSTTTNKETSTPATESPLTVNREKTTTTATVKPATTSAKETSTPSTIETASTEETSTPSTSETTSAKETSTPSTSKTTSAKETSTPSTSETASTEEASTPSTSETASAEETSTVAESSPKISSAIPSISTASVSNDSAFSTGTTTETEEVEENVKDETTQNTYNAAKAGKENLVVQINNLETKNNGAEKSERINEILVNNVQRAQILQQQLGALNNGVQNVAPDSVSNEINPIQGEMDAVSVQIGNIINNAQAKMTGSSDETEEDTQDIEAEEKRLAAKGQNEDDVIEAEQPLTKEDENILAATVSSNAATKTTASTNTDDKIERKLARFNQDSIIESKKKKKKVMAVSAAFSKKA